MRLPEPAARRTALIVVLSALVMTLLVVRRPTAVTIPQFWAEDGVVFFRDAWVCGIGAAVYQYAGYLHLFPRVVASLVVLAPVAWAPALFTAVALLAPIPLIVLLTSPRLPLKTWQRVLAVLPVALPPMPDELHLGVDNSHWHFTLLWPLLAAVRPATTWRGTAGDAALGVLASASSPACVYLLPVAVAMRAWQCRSLRSRHVLAMAPAALMALWQLVVLGTSGRPMRTSSLLDTAWSVTQGAIDTIGLGGAAWRGVPLLLLVALVAGITGYQVWRRGPGVRVSLACLACAGLSWAVLVVSLPVAGMGLASRYHFGPVVMLEWALVMAAPGLVAGLLPVLFVSVASAVPFVLPVRADRGWHAGAACLESGRTDCRIPIHPEGWVIAMDEPVGKRQLTCGNRD